MCVCDVVSIETFAENDSLSLSVMIIMKQRFLVLSFREGEEEKRREVPGIHPFAYTIKSKEQVSNILNCHLFIPSLLYV